MISYAIRSHIWATDKHGPLTWIITYRHYLWSLASTLHSAHSMVSWNTFRIIISQVSRLFSDRM